MNPYESPNLVREKYRPPDTDWGKAAIIFLGVYGFIGILCWVFA